MELPGKRKRGRPKRRFMDVVKEDMAEVEVTEEDTVDRNNGCVPIVLASDNMQASAVESIDTAHHCSSQRPCLGRMRQCGTQCQLICPQTHMVCVDSFHGRDICCCCLLRVRDG